VGKIGANNQRGGYFTTLVRKTSVSKKVWVERREKAKKKRNVEGKTAVGRGWKGGTERHRTPFGKE